MWLLFSRICLGTKLLSTDFVFLHIFPPFRDSIVSLIQMRTLLHFCMPATIAQWIWSSATTVTWARSSGRLICWKGRMYDKAWHENSHLWSQAAQSNFPLIPHLGCKKWIEMPCNDRFTRTWLSHGWGKPTSKQVGRVASKSPDEKVCVRGARHIVCRELPHFVLEVQLDGVGVPTEDSSFMDCLRSGYRKYA